MIHCGSRGLGHQVCTDYVREVSRKLQAGASRCRIASSLRAPLRSQEAERYLGCHAGIGKLRLGKPAMHRRRRAQGVSVGAKEELGATRLSLVYDVAHNIAKFERHDVEGKIGALPRPQEGGDARVSRRTPRRARRVSRHRATGARARRHGTPLCTCSSDREGSMQHAFGSTCHGAGRRMSRTQAVRETRGRDLVEELKQSGVTVRYEGRDTLREETPEAYKDVTEVVRVVEGAGPRERRR